MSILEEKKTVRNIFYRCSSLSWKAIKLIFFPDFTRMKKNFHKIKNLFRTSKFTVTTFVLLFCITMFTMQSSAVSDLIFHSEYTVLADVYYSVFPYLRDETLARSDSYLSNDVSTQWSSIAEVYDGILLGFISIPLVFFGVLFLMKALDNKLDIDTKSRFIALTVVMWAVNPLTTYSVNVGGGYTHEVSPLRYVMQSVTGEVISTVEEFMQSNNNQTISINSVQLAEPRALLNEFTVFAKLFNKNIETTSADLNSKLNVEFKDGKYNARFEMGGQEINMSFLSEGRTNQIASQFGVDFEAQEKYVIKDLFVSIIQHAIKVNENISNIKLAINKPTSSNFTDFDNIYFKDSKFENDYKEYCPTIYEYDLSGADLGVINTYISVASQCASHNFFVKHYSNPNFDANKILSNKGLLKDRHAMLFGLNTNNLNFDDLKSSTISLCKTSYFVCDEAIQMLSRENMDNEFNLGILQIPVHMINKLLSSYFDNSGNIMKHRILSQKDVKGLGYKDKTLDKDADFSISFVRNGKNFGFEIVDPIDLIDIEKLPEPNLDLILNVVSGSGLNSVWQRAKTCFKRPDEIVNGYKCNSAVKELTDLGSGFIQWGFSLKTGAMLMAFNSKNKKGDALKLGSKTLAKYGSSLTAVSAVLTPVAFDNYFKSSPYFNAQGAQEMIMVSLILQHFGLEIVEFLSGVGTVMITAGFLIYYIIFGAPAKFYLAFVRKVFEIMIDTLIIYTRAYLNSYSRGIKGLQELYNEFISDLSMLPLIAVILSLTMMHLDMILIVLFDFIFDSVNANGNTIISQIMNLPVLISLLVSVFIIIKKLPDSILDKVESQTKELQEDFNK